MQQHFLPVAKKLMSQQIQLHTKKTNDTVNKNICAKLLLNEDLLSEGEDQKRHGTLRIVCGSIECRNSLEFSYPDSKSVIRVIPNANGERYKPLFTDCKYLNRPPDKQKISIIPRKRKKPRLGRVVRADTKRWKKRNKTDQLSIPSSVTIDIDDKGNVSSISTEADKKRNVNCSIARSKKLVQDLRRDNKTNQAKIASLIEKIKQLNEYLVKEKKASNTLIATSAIEYAELLSTTQSTIIESKCLMKDFDKEREKEKLSTQAKERKERICK